MNRFYLPIDKRLKASFILSLLLHAAVISVIILIISASLRNNSKDNRTILVTLAVSNLNRTKSFRSRQNQQFPAHTNGKKYLKPVSDKTQDLKSVFKQKTNLNNVFQSDNHKNENQAVQRSRTGGSKKQVAQVRSITRVHARANDGAERSGGLNRNKNLKSSAGNIDNDYPNRNLAFIAELIKKNLKYPFAARKMGWTGTVTVRFEITRKGIARNFKILKTSGYSILDENAVAAIKKINSFPKPNGKINLTIPIAYHLH